MALRFKPVDNVFYELLTESATRLVEGADILAEMLGVRRQSVSEVATFLRRKGLIEYKRGHITIVNRKKLEAAACCECYGVMNAYYHRLLPSAA